MTFTNTFSTYPIFFIALGSIPLFLLYRLICNTLLSPLRQFPGPRLARVTDFYRAWISRSGHADDYYRHWHDQYGAAVRVGTNAISVSDPSLIGTIYATKAAWLKSEMYRPNDILLDGRRISNIFNTADKAFHARISNPIRGLWSNTKILEVEPLVDETIELFTHTLEERFGDGEVCDADRWLEYFSWDVMSNTAFGKHHGFVEEGRDVKDMLSISEQGLKYFAFVSQVPWLDAFLDKNPVLRLGPQPLVEGYLACGKVYQNYLQDLESGKALKGSQTHFMDKYTCLKVTTDVADDNQIMGWLMVNMVAGGDSTAGVCRSIIYWVAKHPAVYKRLRNELDKHVTRLPAQYKEVRDLPYLSAVIWESLRYTPPVGLMLERVVPEGGLTLPDGRFIPAGVKVGINPTVTSRDEDTFGAEVDVFRPERWLKKEDESDEDFSKRQRRMMEVTDLAFGAGNRVCMGKPLVRMVLWKVFATLYREFDVGRPVVVFPLLMARLLTA